MVNVKYLEDWFRYVGILWLNMNFVGLKWVSVLHIANAGSVNVHLLTCRLILMRVTLRNGRWNSMLGSAVKLKKQTQSISEAA